jgi:hypothetical protein
VVLLVTALRQGKKPSVTLQRLKAFCGVWRSTVNRWQSYFRNLFAKSINYRRLSGYFIPPIAADQLPKSLLRRFCCCDPLTALVSCLHTLASGP